MWIVDLALEALSGNFLLRHTTNRKTFGSESVPNRTDSSKSMCSRRLRSIRRSCA